MKKGGKEGKGKRGGENEVRKREIFSCFIYATKLNKHKKL